MSGLRIDRILCPVCGKWVDTEVSSATYRDDIVTIGHHGTDVIATAESNWSSCTSVTTTIPCSMSGAGFSPVYPED